MPFEVRFLHEPTEPHAYLGTAHGSSIYHIYKDEGSDVWQCQMVISIPKRQVSNWIMDEMPGLLTDNIISMDDRFLYLSLWFHGEVHQYNIEDRANPKLVGKAIVGGLLWKTKVNDINFTDYAPTVIKNKTIHGGPHALQLSLDGKRLYVTTALNTPWDEQFYPEMVKEGASVVMFNVDTEKGGLQLDPNFLIDLGNAPGGTYGVHQVRYPGGDCTSDIFS